jgi:type II secretion system protein D
MEDVHITSDPHSNSLVISANAKTMDLVLGMIHELDVPAAIRAGINVFQLKKANAVLVSNLLQQLFLGTSTTAGRTATPAAPTAFGAPGTTSTTSNRLLITPTGEISDGASLIELHVSVDERTNSLIVAGSKSDLDTIHLIIAKLEDQATPERNTMVFKLRNAAAADVAQTLQTFFNQELSALTAQITAFETMQKEIIVVPDSVSNSLLVSATPTYFTKVQHIIDYLDATPPQVMIQVLIAEVDLSDNDELGVEISGQSPILFSRGIGATNAVGDASSPGFSFNNTTALPSATLATPDLVGFQGLNNLGTGRTSGQLGLGGLVLTASSNAVNVLIRALKVQQRIEILSRPQVMAYDNQSASIQIGQDVPYLSTSTVSALGTATASLARRSIGVILNVVPRITPDGRVIMRVTPEVSSVAQQAVPLGGGNFGTSFNVQTLDTTVAAADGETVLIGGLIAKRDQKTENKVPFLGDLPGVGALFRFRARYQTKTELVVILTPHIVYGKMETDRIMCQETARMEWTVPEVDRFHGHGIELIAPPGSAGMTSPRVPAPVFNGVDPAVPTTVQPTTPEKLPKPNTPVPNNGARGNSPVQPAAPVIVNAPPQVNQVPMNPNPLPPAGLPMPMNNGPIAPAPQSNTPNSINYNNTGTEARSWSIARPNQ